MFGAVPTSKSVVVLGCKIEQREKNHRWLLIFFLLLAFKMRTVCIGTIGDSFVSFLALKSGDGLVIVASKR